MICALGRLRPNPGPPILSCSANLANLWKTLGILWITAARIPRGGGGAGYAGDRLRTITKGEAVPEAVWIALAIPTIVSVTAVAGFVAPDRLAGLALASTPARPAGGRDRQT